LPRLATKDSFASLVRITLLLAAIAWLFTIPTLYAEQDQTKATIALIEKMSLKEEWSVKDLKELARELNAISGEDAPKARLGGVRFWDSEDTISITFSMIRKGADEPVGGWNIVLTNKKGTYVHREHQWFDN
jgi:hypothetical protein